MRDRLLLEVVKLEGKLKALQRANVFTLLPEVGSPKDQKPVLAHNVSAFSTDCPDESTEGMETPSNADGKKDISSGSEDSDMSSMSDDE